MMRTLSWAALFAAAILPLLQSDVARAQDTTAYDVGTSVRVVLIDGTVHVGEIQSIDEAIVVLESGGRVRTSIPRERIRRIENVDGVRFPTRDPNNSRLLFAPTARPLAHGSGYVAVYELFFPFVAVGLHDVVTLSGGVSIIPGVRSQALYLAPKATLYSRRDLSVAVGGFIGTTTRFDDSGGLLFGIATYGRPDAALTFGAGFAFVEGEFSTRPALLLAGEYQVSNVVKLISENYVVPGYADAILASGGIRFFGRRLAADVGLLTTPTALGDAEGFPFFPWLGFVYNFAQGR